MKYGYALFSAWPITKDKETLFSVLRKVKEIGYDGVEFFLYYDVPAEELKLFLDEIGLEAFSTHPRLHRFFDNLDEEIAYAKTVGINTLVMPYVPDEDRNEAYYEKVLAAIPGWQEKCKKAGLHLAWHNHEFEFEPYKSEKRLMDAILKEHPGLEYEIDTFWGTFAGMDTVSYMEQWKDRIRFVHFKDYEGADEPDKEAIPFCPVGEGIIDVESIARQVQTMNVEWAVVEQDTSKTDPLESAVLSLKNLKAAFKGEGK